MSRPAVVVHWFRRDLRLHDNHGLWHALGGPHPVLPIFIFDQHILSRLSDPSDRRVDLIHRTLRSLQQRLEDVGSSLWVGFGDPAKVMGDLLRQFDVRAVHTNRDHEPYAVQRDAQVEELCGAHGIAFSAHKDHSVFERSEVMKDDGKPYTVFTPYMRKWRAQFNEAMMMPFASELRTAKYYRTAPFELPSLEALGFRTTDLALPTADLSVDLLSSYHERRNTPSVPGTSRLSTCLRFGMVSVREVLRACWKVSPTFSNELIWREFFMQVLWHFPHVVKRPFKPAFDQVQWTNDEEAFAAWCEGRTGYPIVDAGMRELNATGLMHNRVRMITASFLTKHLLIDWRWGEAYFADKLLDFELSSNNGNWQWAAGSGCDAAPYFRIFSPAAQTARFDPKSIYIRRWVPELGTERYPGPIVDHDMARKRALAAYKAGIGGAVVPASMTTSTLT